MCFTTYGLRYELSAKEEPPDPEPEPEPTLSFWPKPTNYNEPVKENRNPEPEDEIDLSKLHPKARKWLKHLESMAATGVGVPIAGAGARMADVATAGRSAAQFARSRLPPEMVADLKREGRAAAAVAAPLFANAAQNLKSQSAASIAEVAQVGRSAARSMKSRLPPEVAANLKQVKGPASAAAGSWLASAAQGMKSTSSLSKMGPAGLAAGVVGGIIAGTAMYMQNRKKKDKTRKDGNYSNGSDLHEDEDDEDDGHGPLEASESTTYANFAQSSAPVLYLHV